MSRTLILGLCAAIGAAACLGGGEATASELKTAKVDSADGVPIAYQSAGAGEIALRSINGDLYPTNVAANQEVADYDAVVMEHTGHYPMLEAPEEFNRHLTTMLEDLGLTGGATE